MKTGQIISTKRMGRVVFRETKIDMPSVDGWEVRFEGSLMAVLVKSCSSDEVHLSWGWLAPLCCTCRTWASLEEAKADLTDLIKGYARAHRLGVEPDDLLRAIEDLQKGRDDPYSRAKSVAWEVLPHRIGITLEDVALSYACAAEAAANRPIDQQSFTNRLIQHFDEASGRDENDPVYSALVETWEEFVGQKPDWLFEAKEEQERIRVLS